MFLCIHDLVELTGGRLQVASMPPLAGAWVQVPRIVLDVSLVESGDLFWCLTDAGCDADLAYLHGAIGVVCADRVVEPWPGTFSLLVEDSVATLERLVAAVLAGELQESPSRFSSADEAGMAAQAMGDDASAASAVDGAKESSRDAPELKVLQLWGTQGVDIYPSTCGRSAKGHSALRCRRRAA
jgi:hypothetical protein